MYKKVTVKEKNNLCNEERKLIERLKRAEVQIKNGEIIEADVFFKEMREKYEY